MSLNEVLEYDINFSRRGCPPETCYHSFFKNTLRSLLSSFFVILQQHKAPKKILLNGEKLNYITCLIMNSGPALFDYQAAKDHISKYKHSIKELLPEILKLIDKYGNQALSLISEIPSNISDDDVNVFISQFSFVPIIHRIFNRFNSIDFILQKQSDLSKKITNLYQETSKIISDTSFHIFKNGLTIEEAIDSDNINALEELLKDGESANVQINNLNAIDYAKRENKPDEIIDLLKNAGGIEGDSPKEMSYNKQSVHIDTPVDINMIEKLINNSNKIELTTQAQKEMNLIIYELAKSGRNELLSLLLDNLVNMSELDLLEPFRLLLRDGLKKEAMQLLDEAKINGEHSQFQLDLIETAIENNAKDIAEDLVKLYQPLIYRFVTPETLFFLFERKIYPSYYNFSIFSLLSPQEFKKLQKIDKTLKVYTNYYEALEIICSNKSTIDEIRVSDITGLFIAAVYRNNAFIIKKLLKKLDNKAQHDILLNVNMMPNKLIKNLIYLLPGKIEKHLEIAREKEILPQINESEIKPKEKTIEKDNYWILKTAIAENNIDVLNSLIKKVDINQIMTLHKEIDISGMNLETAQILLKNRFNPNPKLLLQMVGNGNEDVAEMIMKEAHMKNLFTGQDFLIKAVSGKCHKIMREFIKLADIPYAFGPQKRTVMPVGYDYFVLIDIAVQNDDAEMLEILIGDRTVSKMPNMVNAQTSILDPLLSALKNKKDNAAREILKRKVFVTSDSLIAAKDAPYEIFEIITEKFKTKGNQKEMLKVAATLISSKCTKQACYILKDLPLDSNIDGISLVNFVIKYGTNQMLKTLIDRGAIIEDNFDRGRSPLLVALTYCKHSTANALIEAGIIPDFDQMNRCFYIACKNGYMNIAKFLIAQGVRINMCFNEDNETPLIAAASNGHHNIVKMLLQNNVDFNAVNINGNNALHFASIFGSAESVRNLISAGASFRVRNEQGLNSLFIAAIESHPDVVRVILETNKHIITDDEIIRLINYMFSREFKGKGRDKIVKEIVDFGLNDKIANALLKRIHDDSSWILGYIYLNLPITYDPIIAFDSYLNRRIPKELYKKRRYYQILEILLSRIVYHKDIEIPVNTVIGNEPRVPFNKIISLFYPCKYLEVFTKLRINLSKPMLYAVEMDNIAAVNFFLENGAVIDSSVPQFSMVYSSLIKSDSIKMAQIVFQNEDAFKLNLVLSSTIFDIIRNCKNGEMIKYIIKRIPNEEFCNDSAFSALLKFINCDYFSVFGKMMKAYGQCANDVYHRKIANALLDMWTKIKDKAYRYIKKAVLEGIKFDSIVGLSYNYMDFSLLHILSEGGAKVNYPSSLKGSTCRLLAFSGIMHQSNDFLLFEKARNHAIILT